MAENTNSRLESAMDGLWSTKSLVCGKSSLSLRLPCDCPYVFKQTSNTRGGQYERKKSKTYYALLSKETETLFCFWKVLFLANPVNQLPKKKKKGVGYLSY